MSRWWGRSPQSMGDARLETQDAKPQCECCVAKGLRGTTFHMCNRNMRWSKHFSRKTQNRNKQCWYASKMANKVTKPPESSRGLAWHWSRFWDGLSGRASACLACEALSLTLNNTHTHMHTCTRERVGRERALKKMPSSISLCVHRVSEILWNWKIWLSDQKVTLKLAGSFCNLYYWKYWNSREQGKQNKISYKTQCVCLNGEFIYFSISKWLLSWLQTINISQNKTWENKWPFAWTWCLSIG